MNSKSNKSDDTLRVLLVGPLPPPYGGIPFYVQSLLAADIPGVEYTVFNTAFPKSVVKFAREGRRYGALFEGGATSALKMLTYVFLSYPKLALTIIQQRPHIVQVFTCSYWGYWRNILYVASARLMQRKVVFHLLNAIDNFYSDSGSVQKVLLRASLKIAHIHLLQSPGLKEWFSATFHRPALGLWNGIDIEHLPVKAEIPPGMAPLKRPIGLTAGALGIGKGTLAILQALKSLRTRGKYISWVFIGGGDVEDFARMAEELGVGDHVWFTGTIDEATKWQCFRHADFYCLPSLAEGQPISIIEAMAMGLPVVSTSVGSIPEMVEQGEHGIIIPPNEQDALEEALARIAANKQTRVRMGKAGRVRALQRHHIRHLYKNLVGVYQKLVC